MQLVWIFYESLSNCSSFTRVVAHFMFIAFYLFIYKFNYLFVLQTPNTTNSLCGYKIVTGQPSDRLGEDFAELFKDFNER